MAWSEVVPGVALGLVIVVVAAVLMVLGLGSL